MGREGVVVALRVLLDVVVNGITSTASTTCSSTIAVVGVHTDDEEESGEEGTMYSSHRELK
jgi:hypothetical protein